MKTIVSTIVNANMNLIGFEVEAPAKELGGQGDAPMVKAMTVKELAQVGFKNRQVEVKPNGAVMEKNGTKLKNLPMKVYGNGALTPISNTLTLARRVMSNNQLVGFDVDVAGQMKRLRTGDIASLANWMKCANFIVKYKDGVAFLSAPQGATLNDLPAVNLGQPAPAKKPQAAPAAKQEAPKPEAPKLTGTDMLSLMDVVKQLNGLIVFLPSEKYKAAHRQDRKTADGFRAGGIADFGAPLVKHSEKALNVTGSFRRIGEIGVTLSDGRNAVFHPHVLRSKVLFMNGTSYVGAFGIAVDAGQEAALTETLKGAVQIKEVTDPNVIGPIQESLGQGKKLFAVTTSNIEAISAENAKQHIMSNAQIRQTVLQLLGEKSKSAFINGASKMAYDKLKETSDASARGEVYSVYRGMSAEDLKILEDAGIDIYSNTFTKTVETGAKQDEDAKRIAALVAGEAPDEEKEAGWEVEYTVAGCGKPLSFKEIAGKFSSMADEAAASKKFTLLDKVPGLETDLKIIVSAFEQAQNEQDVYEIAEKFKGENEKIKKELIKKLWFNNMARLKAGNYKEFKLPGFTQAKQLKTSVAYTCNEAGCEDLGVKISTGLKVAQ